MEGSNWHFSADYREARGVFLEAAQNARARIESFIHPASGPDGLELAPDVAEFGPADASKVLFICSATHGVEGFSESAIQTGLIREGWPDRLPTATKLVLIHAINPYGFAFVRRFDENNVDLNRNFMDPERAFLRTMDTTL